MDIAQNTGKSLKRNYMKRNSRDINLKTVLQENRFLLYRRVPPIKQKRSA